MSNSSAITGHESATGAQLIEFAPGWPHSRSNTWGDLEGIADVNF